MSKRKSSERQGGGPEAKVNKVNLLATFTLSPICKMYFDRLVELLKSSKDLENSAKGVLKQVSWAGGGAAVGGIVAGPIGAFIGTCIGGIVGLVTADDYKSFIKAVMDMTDKQKKILVQRVKKLVARPTLEDLGDVWQNIKEQVIDLIKDILSNNIKDDETDSDQAADESGSAKTADESGSTETAEESASTKTANESGSSKTNDKSGSTKTADESGSTKTAGPSSSTKTAYKSESSKAADEPGSHKTGNRSNKAVVGPSFRKATVEPGSRVPRKTDKQSWSHKTWNNQYLPPPPVIPQKTIIQAPSPWTHHSKVKANLKPVEPVSQQYIMSHVVIKVIEHGIRQHVTEHVVKQVLAPQPCRSFQSSMTPQRVLYK